MTLYRRALRYAYVLDPQNYRDHVHSAYLYHYNKTGGNLFEMHQGYVFKCVKFMWRWDRSNRTFHKEFVEYLDEDHFTTISPDRILESSDSIEMISKRVAAYKSGGESSVSPETLVACMRYIDEGYNGNEIGELLGVSFQTASNYKKKIRGILSSP